MQNTFSPGDPVRFTRGPLGLLESEGDFRFAPETVSAGDSGQYVGPHADAKLAEQGWHTIRVELEGELVRFCPCHEGQFEAVV
jgi:hypothetical protein